MSKKRTKTAKGGGFLSDEERGRLAEPWADLLRAELPELERSYVLNLIAHEPLKDNRLALATTAVEYRDGRFDDGPLRNETIRNYLKEPCRALTGQAVRFDEFEMHHWINHFHVADLHSKAGRDDNGAPRPARVNALHRFFKYRLGEEEALRRSPRAPKGQFVRKRLRIPFEEWLAYFWAMYAAAVEEERIMLIGLLSGPPNKHVGLLSIEHTTFDEFLGIALLAADDGDEPVHAVFPPLYWMSCVVSNVRARVLTRRPGARFYLQQPGHPDVGITAVRVGQVFAAVRNRTNVPATFHPRHVRYLGAAMLLALRFEGLPVVEQQYARHSRYLKSSEDVKPIWQAVERNHDAGLRVRTLLDYFQPPPNLHGCVSCGALEAPKGADCLTCNFSFRMPLKPEQRIIAEQICSLMQDLQQLSGISPWDRAQEALEAFRKEQQDRKQTEDGP